MRINIPALSVNKVWCGRRFKTPDYKQYEKDVLFLLPKKIEIPKDNKKILLKITFGVSSKNSDLDNLLKPFEDLLQKKYGFNDKRIYRIEAEKIDVEKQNEYIDFVLSPA